MLITPHEGVPKLLKHLVQRDVEEEPAEDIDITPQHLVGIEPGKRNLTPHSVEYWRSSWG